MLADIIISILLGGGVGYATNNLAVKMLFKKYFGKFGGIIQDHYEEFITSMSLLVEEDLINQKTLSGELSSDDFKKALQKWIEDLLLQYLPDISGEIYLSEIPGIEKSVENLIELKAKIEKPVLQGLLGEISKKELRCIISKEQYEYIIKANLPLVLENSQPYINRILSTFLSGKQIDTLVSHKTIKQVKENIKTVIQKIDFTKLDSDFDTAYEEILNAIDADALLAVVADEIAKMRPSDFLKDSKQVSNELFTRFVNMITSNEGQLLFVDVIDTLLNDAKKINLKIEDILSPNNIIGKNIIGFIKEKLPGIINKIAAFIECSKTEIETIIDRAIDKELAESGTSGKILAWIKTIFVDSMTGNISKQANIVGIIIDEIHKKGDSAGNEISAKILNYIENHTIGEIITSACDKNIITAKIIVDIIAHNVRDLPQQKLYFLDEYLNKRIADSIDSINLSAVKTKVMPTVFEKVKTNYIYTDKLKAALTTACADNISNIKIDNIKLNKNSVEENIINIGHKLCSKKIAELFDLSIASPLEKINIDLKSLWQKNKHHQLNDIYKIAQNDAVYERCAEGILDLIVQHLDSLLSGQVSGIVNKELSKHNSNEINEMVEDFMGKELKPINFIGLALGAIIGGISVWLAAMFNVPNNAVWYMFPIYGIIFSFVGMGTNAIAIRMLFKPYKSAAGFKFSPFVGVVAAKKSEFAKNIAKFVQNKTLNDQALQNEFIKNKNTVKQSLKESISNSNYKMIDTFLQNEQRANSVSVFIYKSIKKYINDNSNDIASLICKLIKDAVETGMLKTLIPAIKIAIIKKLNDADISSYINNFIQNEIASGTEEKNLSSSPDVICGLSCLINDSINKLFGSLSITSIKNMLAKQNDIFVSYINNNSFEDLAGAKNISAFSVIISDRITALITKAMPDIVDYIQKQEFDPDTQLHDLFNGALSGLIEKNIGAIINTLVKEIGKHRNEIKYAIQAKVNEAPMLIKGLAFLTDTNSHISRIVDMLIDEDLVKFFETKKTYFVTITNTLLDNKLSALGFNNESFKRDRLTETLTLIAQSPAVSISILRFVEIIVGNYSKVPIYNLCKILNISSIDDLLAAVDKPLLAGIDALNNRMKTKEFSIALNSSIKMLLTKIANDVPLADLLKSIETDKEISNIITLLKKDGKVMDTAKDAIENILDIILSNKNFYDESILQKDLKLFVDGYSIDPIDSIVGSIIPQITEIVMNINNALTKETKDALCADYFLNAAIESCGHNFSNIINAIDVQNVVEREINAMHPRQVEKMFYKFAGTYFRKLIFYGWIGLFGGLLSYGISCLLKNL